MVLSAGVCETSTQLPAGGGTGWTVVGGAGGAATTGTFWVLAVVTQSADTQASPVGEIVVGTLTCHHNPSALFPVTSPVAPGAALPKTAKLVPGPLRMLT